MIFVTGGTGLLGQQLLVELTQKNVSITALYRNKSKIEEVRKCFDFYLKEKAASFFEKINWEYGDILDAPRVKELLVGKKEIYHCAGLVSLAKSDFSKMIAINRYATANLVDMALAFNIEKFCYVSSIIAIGNKDIPPEVEIDESGQWYLADDTSGYSIAKYSGEKEVWRGINEGLNAVIVNPGVIIGAGNWGNSSMEVFKVVQKRLTFYPPGSTGYVDARDVAKIMFQLMANNCFGERFICVGENAPIKKFLEAIAIKLGKKPPFRPLSKRLAILVQKAEAIFAFLTFSKPKLTKDVIKESFELTKYSNNKIKNTLQYSFYNLEDSVANAVDYHNWSLKNK